MLSMTVNSSIQSGNYLIHSGVITNNGNHYNTGNGRFTCPVAGFYYASIMIMSNNSNTTMDSELHKNSNNFNNILVPYQAAMVVSITKYLVLALFNVLQMISYNLNLIVVAFMMEDTQI